jgi:hypothetical protein
MPMAGRRDRRTFTASARQGACDANAFRFGYGPVATKHYIITRREKHEGPWHSSKKERHKTEARSSGTSDDLSKAKNERSARRCITRGQSATQFVLDNGRVDGGGGAKGMRDRRPGTA